jgi:hypothetical protein
MQATETPQRQARLMVQALGSLRSGLAEGWTQVEVEEVWMLVADLAFALTHDLGQPVTELNRILEVLRRYLEVAEWVEGLPDEGETQRRGDLTDRAPDFAGAVRLLTWEGLLGPAVAAARSLGVEEWEVEFLLGAV